MEIDRRADGRGLEGEIARRDVDLHEVGLVVEHRREDRLRKCGIEARRHDQEIRDA